MEIITLIAALVLLVFGVLQIILFFKLWGMTNDVRKMRCDVKEIADKLRGERISQEDEEPAPKKKQIPHEIY